MTFKQLKRNTLRFFSIQKWLQSHLMFWAFLLGMLPQLEACGGSEASSVAQNTVPAGVMTYQVLDAGSADYAVAPSQVTVRSAAEWQNLWTQVQKVRSPTPSLPAVDFNQKTVAAMFLGNRANACYGMQIVAVVSEGSRIVVQYRETNEAAGRQDVRCPAVVVNPYQILSLPAVNVPITYVKVA